MEKENKDTKCFEDFFPKSNKKYSKYDQEDTQYIPDYDLQSYYRLIEANDRKNKNYCKRKCYNQKFSPNKYNDKTNLFPDEDQLAEFIYLMDLDPDENKRNCNWVFDHKKEFGDFDQNEIIEQIINFINHYPHKQLPNSFDELVSINDRTRFDTKRSKEQDDIIVVYKGKDGELLTPLTKEASIKYGKGTKWCTSAVESTNYFDRYLTKGPLFIFIEPLKKGCNKYQFQFETMSFKDILDHTLTPQKMEYFRHENPVTRLLFEEKENELLNSNKFSETISLMIKYAQVLGENRWSDGEKYILDHYETPNQLVYYAKAINQRWKEAEKILVDTLMSGDKIFTEAFVKYYLLVAVHDPSIDSFETQLKNDQAFLSVDEFLSMFEYQIDDLLNLLDDYEELKWNDEIIFTQENLDFFKESLALFQEFLKFGKRFGKNYSEIYRASDVETQIKMLIKYATSDLL